MQIRRSAGVREECLFEWSLRALPAIVVHHDVGTLAEAGQRLVRRGRGIDSQFHRVRIRQQVCVEKFRAFWIDLAVLLLELGILSSVGGAGIALSQRFAGSHG